MFNKNSLQSLCGIDLIKHPLTILSLFSQKQSKKEKKYPQQQCGKNLRIWNPKCFQFYKVSSNDTSRRRFPKSSGSVWPAASSFSQWWWQNRAAVQRRREPVVLQLPAWRAVTTIRNALPWRDAASMDVAAPARLPRTCSRVRSLY